MTTDLLERILTARVYDVARETALSEAPLLSARLGHRVLLKREDEQPVFSFKLRGAFNKMVRLPPAALKRGVIAASAGNHAQGVALAAERLGCRAVIVMPRTTPAIKVDAVHRRGAEVVLHGDGYDDAYQHARALEAKRGLTFVHPYDDLDVIAGQGTVAMELLRQHPGPIEAVFVPVGGGGLIAGMGAYLHRLRPETRVIGVEPHDAAAMTASLAAGRRVRLREVGLFADGVAVKQVGREPFRLARQTVSEMVTVSTDEICAAIKDVFQDTRSILEPAGALAVAGAKAWAERGGARGATRRRAGRGSTLVAVASGANTDFDRLRFVAERAEVGEHREAVLGVTIAERPGSFLAFCELLGRRGITEFNYRISDALEAHVFVGVAVKDRAETAALVKLLRADRLSTVDLSDDELAKQHLRHLVGGRSPLAHDERLFRFDFPERPGALLTFLKALARSWNVSLFHYRNQGSDVGRVLVGIQVPARERAAFGRFLRATPYRWVEESENAGYRMFLAAGG